MHILLPLLLLLTTPSSSSAAAVPGKPPHHVAAAAAAAAAGKKLPFALGGKKEETEKQQQETKYFHEAGGSMELGHYDARYFRGEVPYGEHGPALRRLARSWLAAARALGVGEQAWLAHGTLLGWRWNGRVMPWDYDLDVQMPAATLAHLGRHFNRTLHDYVFVVGEGGEDGPPLALGSLGMLQGQGGITSDGGGGGGGGSDGVGIGISDGSKFVNKTYLLDINPHHGSPGRGSGHNVIDARWIDVSSGLFVDITGLAEREAAERPGVWSCKNAHRYRTAELWPLRRTEFEGVPAAVPFAFDKILADEYGAKSLTATEWAGHHWVPEFKEWVKDPEPPPKEGEPKPNQQQGNAVVVVVEKTVVKGGE
ncbi:endoplasmic reticulum retention protein [Hypoxylon texense]